MEIIDNSAVVGQAISWAYRKMFEHQYWPIDLLRKKEKQPIAYK